MISIRSEFVRVKRKIRRCYYAGLSHENKPGGIAVTFDDAFVDEWHALREMLNRYNAKVTFFVSHFNRLGQYSIDKLKALRDDGHEIGFHGLKHLNAVKFMESRPIEQYMNEEILPGIEMMA